MKCVKGDAEFRSVTIDRIMLERESEKESSGNR